MHFGKVLIFFALVFSITSAINPVGVSAQESQVEKLNLDLSSNKVASKTYPLRLGQRIDSFKVSGTKILQGDASLVRVIITDDNNTDYLVYESSLLIDSQERDQFNLVCEETCLLDSINVVSVRLELVAAEISLVQAEITYGSRLLEIQNKGESVRDELEKLKISRDVVKLEKIKKRIGERGLKWKADKTSISDLTYAQKKVVFNRGVSESLPNLQGWDYYAGGVFKLASLSEQIESESVLTDSFDWRNRHAKNWITAIRDQQKDLCGSCWVFGSVAVVEAGINLHYNTLINPNLSEQQVVCSSPGSCHTGGMPATALKFVKDSGVVTESCYPYSASDNCPGRCSNWEGGAWKIENYLSTGGITDDILKKNIVEKGPITIGIYSWEHVIALVGFDTEITGETVWIIKNSFGVDWGEAGFGRMIFDQSDRAVTYYIEKPYPYSSQNSYTIRCEDLDGDTYCNWGITRDKPSSCPNFCQALKDCDDSRAGLGPYDTNYNCLPIGQVTNQPSSSPNPTMADKPGDANSDGSVNFSDYTIWINNYSKFLSGGTNADFNNNSIVDGLDFGIWLNNYGG